MTRAVPQHVLRGALAACMSMIAAQAIASDIPQEFTPQVGFAGATHGIGTLRLFGGKPRALRVSSTGRQQPDGSFHLAQTIYLAGKPPHR